VVAVVVRLELVLLVAEEGEVVVREPLEELTCLPDLLRVQRGRVLLESGDDVLDLGVHLAPVLDGLADVAEHPLDVVDHRGGVVALGEPVDLDVHPRLADGLALRLQGAVGHRGDRLELAGDVPDDVEVGVDDDVDVAQLAGQLHGQRVDEERHVVHHHLDDGASTRGPVAVAQGGCVHPDLRGPLGPKGRQLVLRRERAVEVDLAPLGQVLDRDVPVVGAQQVRDAVVGRPAGPPASPGQLDGPLHEPGLVRIVRRR
jgi:hypothetical protein